MIGNYLIPIVDCALESYYKGCVGSSYSGRHCANIAEIMHSTHSHSCVHE